MSASADPINVKLPWQISNQNGMWKMNYRPEDAMKDSLLFWAHTNKGEYVMDLEFGLDVRRSLFLPKDMIADIVSNNAREQLPKYFPKFKASVIEVLIDEDEVSPNSLIFRLEGTLVADKNSPVSISTEVR